MPSEPRLVLASGSPRRRDLLAEAGYRFTVQPADIDETARPDEAPADLARRLAREKALAVAHRIAPLAERGVLGSDTLVVLEGRVYGKPADPDQAVAHLRALTGQTHQVLTGVALVSGAGLDVTDVVVASHVSLHGASLDEIREYVATGEPLDKAGAYAIQGIGRRFVAKVLGSETNVIGLPMEETARLLAAAGLTPG